jgi:hypothetical protein
MYLVYGTRELAEAWSALGFRRPDPMAPPVAEEWDEPLHDSTGAPTLDEQGLPRFVRRRGLVDVATRQQRVQEAFDACFTNPEIPARRTCVRVGLQRWEKEVGAKLSGDEFEALCDELGLDGLSSLHIATFVNSIRVPPAEGGEGADPNAPSAVAASSTSSAS